MLSETKETGSGLLFALRAELDNWLGAVRGGNGTWTPATDMYADEGELFIEMELPGVESADVEILTEGQDVTVRARSTDPRPPQHHEIQERRRGTYERTLHLGSEWETVKARASYANGILSIRVPAAPEPEGVRRINLEAGHSIPQRVAPEPIATGKSRSNGNSSPPSPPSPFLLPSVIGASIDGETS